METPNQDQNTQAPETDGVELVGRSAEQKQPAEASEQPKQKPARAFISAVFGTNSKKPQESTVPAGPKVPEQTLLTWQAAEFVQTHKPLGWYLGFVGFFAVLIILAVFTSQYLTVGLFALMAVALVLYANRPPRVLEYRISNYGVYIGEKKYIFDDFASYYQISDYGQPVLELVPNKRFGTLVSLPPRPEMLAQIESTLSQMLPKTDNREDYIDKLFRTLRF